MGGAIPYLAERLDRGYRAFADCRRHINRPPSEYLKTLYYDTVNFNPDAVKLAMSFAGADRILAGSDYPHQIGSIPLMIDTIRALDVGDDVRKRKSRGRTRAVTADHVRIRGKWSSRRYYGRLVVGRHVRVSRLRCVQLEASRVQCDTLSHGA